MDNLNLNLLTNKALPRSFHDTDIGVSALSSPAVVEAAYTQIRQEIEVLEVVIRLWKERHNTLSITARLPPEILSTIFRCVAAARHHSIHEEIGWVKITHVCTHWRRVALECPDLWTTIPFSHPRWAKEMLNRSKMAPLTIVATIYAKGHPHMELVQSAMVEMFRIQKLSLTMIPKIGYETILAELVRPAPLLRNFSVSFNDRTSVPTLPDGIFSGQAPRLQEIELRNCTLAWDAPLLRALKTLKLSYIPFSARPSMDQLIAALSRMPDLTILDLCDVLPVQTPLNPPASQTGSERIVSLPRLTSLRIESDAPEAAFLLSRLIYPPTISITLICTFRSKSANKTDASYDLSSVRSFCDVLSRAQPVRSLMTRYCQYPKSIQFSTYGTRLQPTRRKAKVDLTLISGSPHSGVTLRQSWADITQSLWTSVPVKDLESLHVIDVGLSGDVISHITTHEWSHIITTLAGAKLRNLRVASNSGIRFLRAFSPDAPAPGTGQTEQQPLKIPSLRQLAIEGWVFDDSLDRLSCAELLKICLKDRRRRRAAIKEISLEGCRHITSDDVGTLESYVKEVTWDGFENFTEDEDVYDEDEDEDDEDDYM